MLRPLFKKGTKSFLLRWKFQKLSKSYQMLLSFQTYSKYMKAPDQAENEKEVKEIRIDIKY